MIYDKLVCVCWFRVDRGAVGEMLICLSDENDHVRSTSVTSLAPHALHSPEVVAGIGERAREREQERERERERERESESGPCIAGKENGINAV